MRDGKVSAKQWLRSKHPQARMAASPGAGKHRLKEYLALIGYKLPPHFGDGNLNQAPEGGARFPVDTRLDGPTFVKFHVDLGVGDVQGERWLGFAGIPAVVVVALSVEQHWAEKFHAYTRPRETPNRRVRDLVDLVLVLEREAPVTERRSTRDRRNARFSSRPRTNRRRSCT